MPTLDQAAKLLLAPIAVGVVAAWWWGPRRWERTTETCRARLLAEARPARAVYSRRELCGLPSPVARYFDRTLHEGQPLAVRARVQWAGSFNLGTPGQDKWAPFTATQDVVPGGPGMVWDASIAIGPGVSIRVRDALIAGKGSMRGAMLGLIPVVDKSGTPDLTRATLQRYLAEAQWVPTALLPSQGVRWSPIDDARALATVEAGGVIASVEFRFDAEGRPASTFVPDRLYDDGKRPPAPHPWQGRNLSFTAFGGVQVPDEAVVEWLLPGGTFAYWKGRPVSITYE